MTGNTPPPDPKPMPPGHDLPWHTEACFQASRVIECSVVMDRRQCTICRKEWTEACNFDEEYK